MEAAAFRFFIDIPPARLLRQFYQRFTRQQGVDTDDFWDGVARGRFHIPSSDAYLRDAHNDREWHLVRGYTCCMPDVIINAVALL